MNAIEAAKAHKGVFMVEFLPWLENNEEVFLTFCNLADAIWNAGRTHYSARTIVEKMRFDHAIREVGGKFKINDHLSPDLGRLYALLKPSRLDMFRFKRGGGFREYVRKCSQ